MEGGGGRGKERRVKVERQKLAKPLASKGVFVTGGLARGLFDSELVEAVPVVVERRRRLSLLLWWWLFPIHFRTGTRVSGFSHHLPSGRLHDSCFR